MKKILYAVLALTIATTLMAAKRPQWNKTSANKMYQVYAGTVVVVSSNGLDVYSSSATYSPSIKLYGDTGEVEATTVDADNVTADVVTAPNVNVDTVTASGEITSAYGFFHPRAGISGIDKGQATMTMNNTWIDWDLSAIVPAGAKAVLLSILGNDGTETANVSFRKNGESYNLESECWYESVATKVQTQQFIVAVDTACRLEYKASEAIDRFDMTIMGWWK